MESLLRTFEPVSGDPGGDLWRFKLKFTFLAALAGGLGLLLAAPQKAQALELTGTLMTQPTFTPGDVVVFDGIITNVSSQTAVFGTDTFIGGASNNITVGGLNFYGTPYIDGLTAYWFHDQVLPPGGSIQWHFFFIDTATIFPLNTALAVDGNFIFDTTLPPTSHLVVPVPYTRSVSVPGPAVVPLFGLGVLARLRTSHHRRKTSE